MNDLMIESRDLRFAYEKGTDVLTDVSFSLAEGEKVGLIGRNGAGKSTLLKLLVGLELPNTGTLRIRGIPVERKTLSEIRRMIGYVFQDSDSQLFMTTVEEDVAFAPRNYGFSEEEVEKRVTDALEKVRIPHLRKKSVYKLSGGEKKLASLATILSMTPDIILLDEPTVTLDPGNRSNLIRLLNGLDCSLFIASHDLDFIWDTCSRVLILSEGRIVCEGPSEEILRNGDLLRKNGLELPLSLIQRDRCK